MKILAIRGKNLASLEGSFEVDFTKEPLLSAGIFAISGNTGSGKSTLLDALCLALFDKTPRFNRAVENNVAIQDVRDKTISQGDSRIILRRGTGEGYAEVDFVSLTGEKFRATWLIRRARGKADGSLQNSEMRLFNLSGNLEIPGKKTELLTEIVRLIGLTFDQFTRAVLLAQGDFATFLKAKQAEKAELLEKLTGTEIYSRISISIYEKTKEAEQALQLLEERIKGVELLSEEEASNLSEEKANLQKELADLKKETGILTEKINWIQQENQLQTKIAEAEKILQNAQKEIEKSQSRYDYMDKIDSVQEIRDDFRNWDQTQKQSESNQSDLSKNLKAQTENSILLEKQNTECIALQKEQHEIIQYRNRIEPEIIRARELDIELKSEEKNYSEAQNELKNEQNLLKKSEDTVRNMQEQLKTAQSAIEKLQQWFEKSQSFSGIAPRVDLIVNLLNDASNAKQQIHSNQIIINRNQEALISENKHLETLKQETEHLDKLLPAEIAKLRKELSDGTPCPVCGSIHHPIQTEVNDSQINEDELNRLRKKNEEAILKVNACIEEFTQSVSRSETLIKTYETQLKDTLSKTDDYLHPIPDWKTLFEQGNLQEQLEKKAELWNKYSSDLTTNQQRKLTFENDLLNQKNHLAGIQNSLEIKKVKSEKIEAELNRIRSERKDLLKGKTVDEVIRLYEKQKKDLDDKLAFSSESKQTLSSKAESLKAVISRIENQIKIDKEKSLNLETHIKTWLAGKPGLSLEELSELLSKDKQWLISEKQFLNQLKETEITSKATLLERKKNLEQHQKAPIRPDTENEAFDFLEAELKSQGLLLEQKISRLAEIDLIISNHHKGKERIKSFEKELTAQQELTNNWKKLNDLLGSATGNKFKEIAQAYTLDVLLTYTNKHLQELTRRYKLERIPDTLALQVIDLDMLNEVRTVHSLSGGESFLVSLALALGLSSLSSNRMKIESLFIDEGFGSLDADTLRVALDALEQLHSQGRKIGVISHVAEMTERIPTQIRIVKEANGRSSVEIMARG